MSGRRAPCGRRAACSAAIFVAIFTLALAPAIPAAEPPVDSASVSPAVKRKLAALGLIYEDAQQREAGTPERASLLAEFLARSSEFLTENGDVPQLWLLRASVALELNRAREGWESGRALIRLGYENSADQTVQNLFVQLERRNWLGEQPPAGAVATRPVAAPFSPED